ncbi:MAG: hypothetical protein Q7K40_02715 [bacterium]|nr:hypothetical protein [bacterium]
MNDFFVKIKSEKVRIDKRVFLSLLDLSPIKQYVAYENALASNEISLDELKNLSARANIPYPLFFATKSKVDKQTRDKDKNLFYKLPGKAEMQLGFRGSMKPRDIEIIVKDLGRKQEFLKNRVLPTSKDNAFIGIIAKRVAERVSNKKNAEEIREYFEINLGELRKMSKDKVLSYLCNKIEGRNILVSFSSHNYMPQNMSRELGLSGLCIKDKKFPYIFINTRDGDEKPLILETSGRQIFTVISMLVSIGMNKFILSTKSGQIKKPAYKKIFAITGEILIPEADLVGINIKNLDGVKHYAQSFKITPSMLVSRLEELGLISKEVSRDYYRKLSEEILGVEQGTPRQPSQVTGYKKYNGEKLSREVTHAYEGNKISHDEIKNILFRKGKMESTLFREYIEKFK